MTRRARRPTAAALAALSMLVLAAAPAHAGPATEVRVLLVGDSWAEFMWLNRTLRDVFRDNGRPDIEEDGSVTTISGSTAAEWAQPARLQSISDQLDALPTVDVVQLSISGNDFLAGESGGGWYLGISQPDLEALTGRILADVTTVLDHILAHDPAIRIVISLYDYPNFVDSFLFPGCLSTWNDLGNPTPRQINEAALSLQGALGPLVASHPRLHLADHTGLMQFTYGFPDEGIPPGQLLPPGDLDRPSPIEAMFLQADCFHLRPNGYYVLGQNLWQGFYQSHFEGTIFADGFESGSTAAW
ncbi:MAG: hypothetical protein MI919_18525 [Holophagales bacterium]|nr:hypothetical protein [Holophagales bacterium]